jgi:hypothetical protein
MNLMGITLSPRRAGHWASGTAFAVVLVATLDLTACGGGSGPVAADQQTSDSGASGSTLETGPYTKVVSVPGGTAVVALFPDGQAYYSPDGFNLGGGGATVAAYVGALQVTDIEGLSYGIEVLMSDGSAYLSPDGMNLGGGGNTKVAYQGNLNLASLVVVGTGVDAVFSNNGGVYYSPDGLNLKGGGNTVAIGSGGAEVGQIVVVGPGDAVVTRFVNGAVYYSPDNRNLAGGGNTVAAAHGGAAVERLVQVGGGVIAEFTSGAVYLSPTGRNLDGGNGTIAVPAWTAQGNAPFGPRDSAHGAVFLNRLWVSGGFAEQTQSNSCFLTCSYWDLWSSTDLEGEKWDSSASFATASSPNPRDMVPVVNNGVQDVAVPTDFYDAYSATVVWNGELTAIGATVWRSADGVKWARNNLADGVTAAPGPSIVRATENSRAEILGSSLFFLQLDTGQVYVTTDPGAATWTSLGAIPGYTPRCGPAAFVLHGKLWVVGGGACDYSQVYNDVWSSPDGVNWTQSAAPAQWSGRMWPCVITNGDGVVWLVGGYAPTDWNNTSGITRRYGANHADLWYTKDGDDWRQLKPDLGSALPDDGIYEPRHAPTCFVTGASESTLRLVIAAGTGGPIPNGGAAQPLNSVRSIALPFAATLP